MDINFYGIKRIAQEQPHPLPNGKWSSILTIKHKGGEARLTLFSDNKKKLIITTSEA